MRKRDPFVTGLLTLLYIGLAVRAYSLLSALLQPVPLFGQPVSLFGPFGWVPEFLLLLIFVWSLESIRKWNKLGFSLWVAGNAIGLALRVYALLAGYLTIDFSQVHQSGQFIADKLIAISNSGLLALIGPFVSPLIIWVFLQLGSPSTWQQMESHNLLRDLPARKRQTVAHER